MDTGITAFEAMSQIEVHVETFDPINSQQINFVQRVAAQFSASALWCRFCSWAWSGETWDHLRNTFSTGPISVFCSFHRMIRLVMGRMASWFTWTDSTSRGRGDFTGLQAGSEGRRGRGGGLHFLPSIGFYVHVLINHNRTGQHWLNYCC